MHDRLKLLEENFNLLPILREIFYLLFRAK